MRIHLFVIVFIGFLLFLTPGSSEPSFRVTDPDYQGEVSTRFEPHGEQICASGCALSRHPTPPLSEEKFVDLLRAYSSQPMTEDSPALEELLFYGVQSQSYLGQMEMRILDSKRLEFLERELSRDKVVAEFRIIDSDGSVRVGLPPTTVNLDRRYVFEPLNTHDFQPPEASGTVKRVGLNHLWQRI